MASSRCDWKGSAVSKLPCVQKCATVVFGRAVRTLYRAKRQNQLVCRFGWQVGRLNPGDFQRGAFEPAKGRGRVRNQQCPGDAVDPDLPEMLRTEGAYRIA